MNYYIYPIFHVTSASSLNRARLCDMIRHLVLERFAPRLRDRAPDEARIADAMPRIEYQFEVLEEWLGGHDYLAGETVSIADFFLVPMLGYVRMTPEGGKLCDAAPSVMRWWDAMASHASFAATEPAPR